MSVTKNIIIVGGGSAGISTYNILKAKLDANLSNPKYAPYNVVLINPRPFLIHLPATLRMIVPANETPRLEDTVLMPYTAPTKGSKGEIIINTVTKIEQNTGAVEGNSEGKVILEDGRILNYSILVLATGSTYSGPLEWITGTTREEIVEDVREWRARFEKSKEIVLVGAGAVGVELAGEIKDIWPDKPVTIVHREEYILNSTYPVKFRKSLEKRFTKRGINFVLNDELDPTQEIKKGIVVTKKGVELSADLVLPTWGGRPNTGLLSAGFSSSLSHSNRVLVKPTLQVVHHDRIFAGGDIIEWNEQKQAAKYESHAAIICANIISLIEEKPAPLKAEYKTAFEGILITNGRNGGGMFVGILWGLTFGDWISKMIKSRNLFIELTRKRCKLSSF